MGHRLGGSRRARSGHRVIARPRRCAPRAGHIGTAAAGDRRTPGRAGIIGAALIVWCGADVAAQSMRDQCAAAATPEAMAFCESLADAAVTMPARFAVAAIGGNPVPGTASTLGMRLPGSPRWSIALRSTVAPASLPPIGDADAVTPVLWSVNADASVGLFSGITLAPTIGGFGSIDLLASLGVLNEPDDFDRSSPLTWGIGARVGILRESFTAPGVSVSAMFRALPRIEYGITQNGRFSNTAQNAIALRGTVGKRVLGVGLTAGVGHDRISSDVRALYREPGTDWAQAQAAAEEITTGRTSFFGNVSYTLLILNLGAELGWQESGEAPADAHRDAHRGGLFGGIALRLAI